MLFRSGAGIGLCVGTGSLLAAALTGRTPELDLTPFRPERFDLSAGPGVPADPTDQELAGAR